MKKAKDFKFTDQQLREALKKAFPESLYVRRVRSTKGSIRLNGAGKRTFKVELTPGDLRYVRSAIRLRAQACEENAEDWPEEKRAAKRWRELLAKFGEIASIILLAIGLQGCGSGPNRSTLPPGCGFGEMELSGTGATDPTRTELECVVGSNPWGMTSVAFSLWDDGAGRYLDDVEAVNRTQFWDVEVLGQASCALLLQATPGVFLYRMSSPSLDSQSRLVRFLLQRTDDLGTYVEVNCTTRSAVL